MKTWGRDECNSVRGGRRVEGEGGREGEREEGGRIHSWILAFCISLVRVCWSSCLSVGVSLDMSMLEGLMDSMVGDM